jgi:hypothetical protein
MATRVALLTGLVGIAILGMTRLASAGAINADQTSHVKPLGAVNGILIFGVAPVATLALISLIFLRPGSAAGTQRYRPGHGWHAGPTWIGVAAREHHDQPVLDGAEELAVAAEVFEPHALPAEIEPESTADPGATRRQGGAHGTW